MQLIRVSQGLVSYRLDYHPTGVIPLPADPRTVDQDPRYGPWVSNGVRYRPAPPRLRPELKAFMDASWEQNQAAYRHLAQGDSRRKRPDPTKLKRALRQR